MIIMQRIIRPSYGRHLPQPARPAVVVYFVVSNLYRVGQQDADLPRSTRT